MLRCMEPLGRRIKDHAYRCDGCCCYLLWWWGSRPELPACLLLLLHCPYYLCCGASCCWLRAIRWRPRRPAGASAGPGGGGGGGGGWCPCNSKSSQGFPVDTLMGWSCPWRRNWRAQQVRGGGRSCSVDCPEMGALQASRANLRS